MKNKRDSNKLKQLLTLLVALFAIVTTGVLNLQLTHASVILNETRTDKYLRGGYTLNEIRAMLQQGDALGFTRVYRPNGGPLTYQIPTEELMEIFGSPIATNDIQPFSNFTYAKRPIIGGDRYCSESIVIVLLGDGFTVGNGYGQVGCYQNPGAGTFLRSAHDFAETLIGMYPFSLFRDVFKIYAVETPSAHQGIQVGNTPHAGTYLGTYLRAAWDIRMTRTAHALSISQWVSDYAIMTQVIANTTVPGGRAYWTHASYTNINTVGVSSRFLNIDGDYYVPVVWSRAYHYIIIHEVAHSFGQLVDEHGTGFGNPNNLGHANMACATDTDEQLRWGHWLGHAGIIRRTEEAPTGYIFPSTLNTCVMQGWQASFCAVCRAELTRRMAMISEETFEAGRRPDGTIRPETPNVTIAE